MRNPLLYNLDSRFRGNDRPQIQMLLGSSGAPSESFVETSGNGPINRCIDVCTLCSRGDQVQVRRSRGCIAGLRLCAAFCEPTYRKWWEGLGSICNRIGGLVKWAE